MRHTKWLETRVGGVKHIQDDLVLRLKILGDVEPEGIVTTRVAAHLYHERKWTSEWTCEW